MQGAWPLATVSHTHQEQPLVGPGVSWGWLWESLLDPQGFVVSFPLQSALKYSVFSPFFSNTK